jgi:hypothetical protein
MQTYKQANRRYRRVFLPVMAVYAALTFVGPLVMVAFAGQPPGWLMAMISVVTGAPIAIVFWLMMRYLRETDEYTRAIQIEALLTGASLTFSLAVIWGFLELYRVIPRSEFFSSMLMVGPAFFFFYGMAFLVQHLRRRSASGPSVEE